MRASTTSRAACENAPYRRTTGARRSPPSTVKRAWSVPSVQRSTCAAAPDSTLWVDGYSGCSGVGSSGDQCGSPAVAGLPSRAPWRMAVTGRQKR
nr:hypothetical protein [Vulcaniibacterium thermophilum]